MEIPAPYALVLLVLAAWRTWKLLGDDRILDRPRYWILDRFGGDKTARGVYWGDFLTCPFCSGFWISLAWWGAWQVDHHWTEVVSVPLAVSAVVGLLGTTLYALSDD